MELMRALLAPVWWHGGIQVRVDRTPHFPCGRRYLCRRWVIHSTYPKDISTENFVPCWTKKQKLNAFFKCCKCTAKTMKSEIIQRFNKTCIFQGWPGGSGLRLFIRSSSCNLQCLQRLNIWKDGKRNWCKFPPGSLCSSRPKGSVGGRWHVRIIAESEAFRWPHSKKEMTLNICPRLHAQLESSRWLLTCRTSPGRWSIRTSQLILLEA